MSKKIVYLDPGHGGKDSGATGCGHQEKDDVLQMAKAVGNLISPYVTVKYTRKADQYDSPSEKARKANRADADFFVSFHRNDYNEKSNGFEIEVRGNTGSKKVYADYVRKRMKNEIGFRDRGTINRMDLAVLNQTSMPAVLNEIGFMKNQMDTRLFVEKFNLIARIIADGILIAMEISKKEDTTLESGDFWVGDYDKYVVMIKDCPVRKGRGKKYKKIGTIKKGRQVKALYIAKNGAGNLWASVDYGSNVGFIYLGNARPIIEKTNF